MKRLFIVALSVLTLNLSLLTAVPAQSSKDGQRIEKVKRAVSKIGVDENANARLLDGSIVKGRISEIGNNHFVLVNTKTGDARTLTFAQVAEVKRVIDNPFSDPRVLIGIGFLAVLTPLVIMSIGRDY